MDKKKAVWITGAGTGIGRAAALKYAEAGYNVIASSRKSENLVETKSLCEYPDRILTVSMDVKDTVDIGKVYNDIKIEYEIDCLINNAGITSFDAVVNNSFEQIKDIIDTNLLGAVYLIKTVLPGMIERKQGTIINILTVAAKKVFLQSSAYAASKAGLAAYSNALREELRNFGIRIINIFPGATATPIWPQKTLEKHSLRMMQPEDIGKLLLDIYTINSNLVPEEIVIRPQEGDL